MTDNDAAIAALRWVVALKITLVLTGAAMSYLQSPWWAVLAAMAFAF